MEILVDSKLSKIQHHLIMSPMHFFAKNYNIIPAHRRAAVVITCIYFTSLCLALAKMLGSTANAFRSIFGSLRLLQFSGLLFIR